MNDSELNHAGSTIIFQENATVETLLTYLSHKDRQVRQRAVVALGKTGDRRAIEPLIFVLSREFSRGANSYSIIIDILDAMTKIPDGRALDTLVKFESQMVDRNSPKCPTELPAGIITYIDTCDGQLHRIVPKELHFKVLDVMGKISIRLKYRDGEIATRYQAYQDEVIQAEIDRTIPELARVLHEDSEAYFNRDSTGAEIVPDARGKYSAEAPDYSDDTVAGIDYDTIRREMEIEVSEYLRDNERLQSLIRDGQRIKAHIQHAKLEKTKHDTAVIRPWRASVK